MIISQLSIAPVGKDISLSKYVNIAIDAIKKNNVKFETNAMSTIIETEDLEKLFKIIKDARKAVINLGVKRLIIEVKIDERIDKDATIKSKLKSIK